MNQNTQTNKSQINKPHDKQTLKQNKQIKRKEEARSVSRNYSSEWETDHSSFHLVNGSKVESLLTVGQTLNDLIAFRSVLEKRKPGQVSVEVLHHVMLSTCNTSTTGKPKKGKVMKAGKNKEMHV